MEHELTAGMHAATILKTIGNFSLLKNTITISIFYNPVGCNAYKGLSIEVKKTVDEKNAIISLKTLYLYKIKHQHTIQFGHLMRKQILQKVS